MKNNFIKRRGMIGIFQILMGCTAIITFLSINYVNSSYTWLAHTHEVVAQIKEVQTLLTDTQSSVRGFVLSNKETFLSGYYQNNNKVFPAIDKLASLTADNPIQQKNIHGLREVCAEMLTKIRKALAIADNQGVDVSRTFIGEAHGDEIMDRMRRITLSMANEEEKLLAQRKRDVNKSYAIATYGIGAIFLINIAGISFYQKFNGEI